MATLTPHATTAPSLASLRTAIGDVPRHRILLDPPPGSATLDDLLRMTQQTGRLVEWVDGTLVEKPMGYLESKLALWIGHLLLAFVTDRDLGEVSGADGAIRLDAGLVRVPDVAFVSHARRASAIEAEDAIPRIAPDLVVEVLSSSNTAMEMARKRDDYFAADVRLVWEVDPRERTVTVYTEADSSRTRSMGETLDGGEVLPGFEVTLAKLFSVLDR